MKQWMVDIETVGTDPCSEEAAILQIALLECTLVRKTGYWVPGREFSLYQGYDGSPKSEWARKNQSQIYKRCNDSVQLSPEKVREQILDYFRTCGAKLPVRLMGINASVFDCIWLDTFKYLFKAQRDVRTQELVGDFHYRVFEIGSAMSLLPMLFGNTFKYDQLVSWGEKASGIKCPIGSSHEGMFDCYRQLATLNGIIYVLREKGNAK